MCETPGGAGIYSRLETLHVRASLESGHGEGAEGRGLLTDTQLVADFVMREGQMCTKYECVEDGETAL